MDENPFADPSQVNPFMDPSVTQVSSQSTTIGAGLDTPFAPAEPATVPVAPVITQPVVLQPTIPAAGYGMTIPSANYGTGTTIPTGSNYGTGTTLPSYGASQPTSFSQPPRQYNNDETLNKQVDPITTKELECEDISTDIVQPPAAPEKLVENEFRKREEDLEKREQQLREEQKRLEDARVYGDRVPNFPPLPKFFPCTPCVYHNIDFDCPPEHQQTVRRVFYHWQFTVFCYVFNFAVAFGMICALGTDAGSTFGLALLFGALFIPLSFMTWYRMLYNAVRLDSSMRYMLFFFVYGFQIGVSGLAALGISGGGFTGWITAFATLSKNKGLGILAILVSLCWCANCMAAVFLITQIHRTYRSTGQSMEKASGEFAASAGSNRNIGQAVLRSL